MGGNCQTFDGTGSRWCYVSPLSSCRDKQFSARFPAYRWSYEACATPPAIVSPVVTAPQLVTPVNHVHVPVAPVVVAPPKHVHIPVVQPVVPPHTHLDSYYHIDEIPQPYGRPIPKTA